MNREQKFLYGSGEEQVTLSVTVPVHQCTVCGDMFTDHVGEDLRDQEISRYLASVA